MGNYCDKQNRVAIINRSLYYTESLEHLDNVVSSALRTKKFELAKHYVENYNRSRLVTHDDWQRYNAILNNLKFGVAFTATSPVDVRGI